MTWLRYFAIGASGVEGLIARVRPRKEYRATCNVQLFQSHQHQEIIHNTMKLLHLISCPLLIVAAAAQAVTDAGRRSVTVQSWPLSAAQPQPLAQVSYDPATKSSSISSYTPPEVAYSVDDLVRVGVYDDSDSKWRGVVTSAATFDPKYQQKLLLHLDEAGNVWHVAISTIPMPKPVKGKIVNGKRQPPAPVPQIIVDVLLPTPAPQPILNKPIVLSPEGTVEAEKVEKTMLQKYVYTSKPS